MFAASVRRIQEGVAAYGVAKKRPAQSFHHQDGIKSQKSEYAQTVWVIGSAVCARSQRNVSTSLLQSGIGLPKVDDAKIVYQSVVGSAGKAK